MVFDSIFGKPKKESVNTETQVTIFKNAWLLANRALLDAKTGSDIVAGPALVDEARKVIQGDKTEYSAEAHEKEQLATELLPAIDQIYQVADRFSIDSDVSSAHNTTFLRISERLVSHAKTGESLSTAAANEDFTEAETKILRQVTEILSKFWPAK